MNEWIMQFLAHVAALAKGVSERFITMNPPARDEILQNLRLVEPYQAALLLFGGIIYLIWGAKIFRFLVTVNMALVGFMVGTGIGGLISPDGHIWGGLIGALVLGVLAWPLMRFAVSLMAGIAGAFAGYNAWGYFTSMYRPDLVQFKYVGAIIGLLLLGSLAFVLFRLMIILFTSLQGGVMAAAGGIALALRYQPDGQLQETLLKNPHALPLVVAVPALLGFLTQLISLARSRSKPAKEAAAE